MHRLLKITFQSIHAIWAFKLRTVFCLISVALGIASITVIVAATEGAYQKAFEIVGRFGPDALLVFGGGEEARATGQRQKTITLDDIDAVKQSFYSAYLVVPMTSMRDIQVSYKDKKYQTLIVGSTSDYSQVWTWPVMQGSDFTGEDVKGLRNVGLIGQFLCRHTAIQPASPCHYADHNHNEEASKRDKICVCHADTIPRSAESLYVCR